KIFNEISVIEIEVSIDGLDILNETNKRFIFDKDKRAQVLAEYEERCVYGKVEIEFTRKNNDDQSEIKDDVLFDFMERHAAAKVTSGNEKIGEDDRRNLEDFLRKCDETKFKMWCMVRIKVLNFFDQWGFKRISSETPRRIEEAANNKERYKIINKLLKCSRLVTTDEKLYFIDIFSPYLDKMTRDSVENNNIAVSNQTSMLSLGFKKEACKLKPDDLVVQLISNILGSVPLDDETTQYLFIQILSSCNGKHKSIFPRIHNDTMVIQPFTKSGPNEVFNMSLFEDLYEYNVPNMLNRLYDKLRMELGDSFFEEISKSNTLFDDSYVLMVERCIFLNNLAGIEAAKKDFKIQNDKMELGADLDTRFCTWLEIVVETQYCKGLEVVYNTWKHITKEEDIALLPTLSEYILKNTEIEWNNFTVKRLEKICTDEGCVETLLEIFIYCSDNRMVLDGLFKLPVFRSIIGS
ncbi:hypothetical protein PAEPH01_2658, partial [Pancytospora epiphaga]